MCTGDLQEPSIDSVYAPVSGSVGLRLFFVLAAGFCMIVAQLDVSTAFPYGRLD